MKNLFAFLTFILLFNPLTGQEIFKTEKFPEVAVMGSGPTTLLLIPCMSCRWNEWEEFMERNAEKYKMYAVTIPGYGGTPSPDLPKNTAGTPYRDHVLAGLSELMQEQAMKDVVVVGHSWGTMVAIQLAAQERERVAKVISVDGTIESTSWVKPTREERLAAANSVMQTWEPKLKDAEGWSKFNGASVGSTYGKKDSVTTERMLTRIKLIASFMATDRDAMLQYWRENTLIDLTSYLQRITVPILDIQSFTRKDQEGQKAQHLEIMEAAKAPANVKHVFMYDTKHFIMYHRPKALDCIIENFITGKKVLDYAPAESEYFEEEVMN